MCIVLHVYEDGGLTWHVLTLGMHPVIAAATLHHLEKMAMRWLGGWGKLSVGFNEQRLFCGWFVYANYEQHAPSRPEVSFSSKNAKGVVWNSSLPNEALDGQRWKAAHLWVIVTIRVALPTHRAVVSWERNKRQKDQPSPRSPHYLGTRLLGGMVSVPLSFSW